MLRQKIIAHGVSYYRVFIGVLMGVLLFGLCQSGPAAPAPYDYTKALRWGDPAMPAPVLAVPPCKTPPVIDGKYDPNEWDDACALSTLSFHQSSLAYPPAQVYLTYDAKNLYFGYLLHKDKPEWFASASRFRDSATYLDKHIELFLSPDPGTGRELLYQFCINSYGAVYDILNVPSFGQTSPGYNPKINFKTYETQELWYFEGAIDVKDLDPQGRFQNGNVWRANFCWAWPQTSWSSAGTYFWLVRDNMGYLNINNAAPALQWLDSYPLQEGQLDIKTALKNNSTQAQTYRLNVTVTGESETDILATAQQEVTLQMGERKEIRLQSAQIFPGKRCHIALHCTSPDGNTVYYDQLCYSDGKQTNALARTQEAMKTLLPFPKVLGVTCRYGPLSKAVETQADVWFLRRAGNDLTGVRFNVVSPDRPEMVLLSKDINYFEKDLAITKLDLPATLPYGKYLVKAQALGKDNAVVATGETTFTHIDLKDPAVNKPYRARDGHILDWIGTKSGVATEVPPPWTPISGSAAKGLNVLTRTYTLDSSGLPKQVISVGQPLLAGSIRYIAVVNGKEIPLKGAGAVKSLGSDKAGLTSAWQGVAKGAGLTLSTSGTMEYDGFIGYKLTLATPKPIKLDALYLDIPVKKADRMNLPSTHKLLPTGAGQLWESKDDVGNELMNTLVSHVWVGNWQAGMTFIADQSKGWYEQMGRSLEVLYRTTDGVVHLRVYFVQGPQKVENTSLSFSLMATPTRTRDVGYRHYPQLEPGRSYGWLMDMNDGGTTNEKRASGGNPIWNWDDPSPSELDLLKQQDYANKPQLGLPYTNPWFHYPYVVPWVLDNGSPVEPIMLEEWANMPSRWGYVRPVASYRDYMLFNYEWYFKLKHFAGFYIDEAYGAEREDINLINGSGWFDRNGNLRGSYHSNDVRELFKRQYVLGMQYSPVHKPFMYNHTSWGESPQYMSHVNCGILVENLPIGAGEGYLDHMPLSTLQFWSGRMWGHFSGVTFTGLDAAAIRYCEGQLILHDIVDNSEHWSRPDPRTPLLAKFDYMASDVDFTGYWEDSQYTATSDDAIQASIYHKKGAAMVVVCNTDTKAAHTASVAINLKALGMPGATITDLETGKVITQQQGKIQVQLGARDVQYLIVKE